MLPYYSNPRPPPPVGLVLGLRVPAPTSAHPDVFCSSAWITDRTAQPARLCAHHVGSAAAEIVRHGHNPRFLVQQRVRCPYGLPARGLLTCDVQLPAPSVQTSLEESTRPQPTPWFALIPPSLRASLEQATRPAKIQDWNDSFVRGEECVKFATLTFGFWTSSMLPAPFLSLSTNRNDELEKLFLTIGTSFASFGETFAGFKFGALEQNLTLSLPLGYSRQRGSG